MHSPSNLGYGHRNFTIQAAPDITGRLPRPCRHVSPFYNYVQHLA